MLVLTRHTEEVIHIGDNIRVMILRVYRDGGVRLGIDAPPGVEVHRSEVYERIQKSGERRLRCRRCREQTITH